MTIHPWHNGLMATKSQRAPRRTEALSRDVIVTAATEILDAEGEDALTLRALTVRLATGYGAIYHHVTDRNDLLAAATDHVIAGIAGDLAADAGPKQALRAVALGLFDAIDAHPWVGAQLNREPWRPGCRLGLASKPEVTPLQPDGTPLPVETIVTLEEKIPPYVVLEPGQRAASRVHWGSCCGQASDRARVDWPGGSAVATVHGPTQPECSPAQSDNLTTSWFHLTT